MVLLVYPQTHTHTHTHTHNKQGLVSINRELHQVTVRGGTTFNELNRILDDNGLAMSVLGSISEQTVAGAISTGQYINSCK